MTGLNRSTITALYRDRATRKLREMGSWMRPSQPPDGAIPTDPETARVRCGGVWHRAVVRSGGLELLDLLLQVAVLRTLVAPKAALD